MSCDFPDLADWGGLRPGEIEEVAADRAESLAWSAMLGLTPQVTLCPITVWPNATTTAAATTSTSTTTTTDGAVITLERPVGTIVQVRFSGVVFAAGNYRKEGANLRRLDGQDWPTPTDLTRAAGFGEFEIDYYRGSQPGPAYVWAVGQLASEFYLAMGIGKGGRKCRLPDNITAVTRQGVSYQVNAGLFSGGLTGIREIDAVVRRYNPNLLRQATVVASVDSRTNRPLRVS